MDGPQPGDHPLEGCRVLVRLGFDSVKELVEDEVDVGRVSRLEAVQEGLGHLVDVANVDGREDDVRQRRCRRLDCGPVEQQP